MAGFAWLLRHRDDKPDDKALLADFFAYQAMVQRYIRNLSLEFDLSEEALKVLIYIINNPEGVSRNDICDFYKMHRSNLSRVMSVLVKKNFVQVKGANECGQYGIITATLQAEKHLERLKDIAYALEYEGKPLEDFRDRKKFHARSGN